ncbi:MAG TPA: FecR domain-containing protein [Dinghuibacter sp.]|uniref:FecR family protein n=1 Tax=Dinghuibacter sp. TaxID=2024697 RepID=UPI002B6828CC|nr:FecR domain-containing protein [Dinghuibacter sp.]HTJ12339.1 FecR domain-containing protein [Dinghuibacter sp.]
MQTEKEDQRYLQEHPELGNLQEEFEQADGETPLPEGYSEDMLQTVVARTQTGNGRVWPIRIALSAAAAILILVGVGLLLRETRPVNRKVMARTAKKVRWLTRTNTTGQQDAWTMPDGSTAILYPNARIQYPEDFGHGARDAKVEGKVFFEVVRDEHAPFAVYTGGLKTEVLGTAFKVVNAASEVQVELFTGKVRVDVPDSNYVLTPGQELTWRKDNTKVWVTSFNRRDGKTKLLDGKPGTLANWYLFNDQNLGTVFDQLSAIYGMDIEYDDRAIRNMYFLGRLDRKDSLDKILNDLALLNHLTLTRRGSTYRISK